jgi:hypothetical protein
MVLLVPMVPGRTLELAWNMAIVEATIATDAAAAMILRVLMTTSLVVWLSGVVVNYNTKAKEVHYV